MERIEAELESLLAISSRQDGWKPSLVKTIATEGKGIEECARAIQSWRESQKQSPFQLEKRIQIQKERLLELVHAKVLRSLLRDECTAGRLDELARGVVERSIDPFSAAEILLAAWEAQKSY